MIENINIRVGDIVSISDEVLKSLKDTNYFIDDGNNCWLVCRVYIDDWSKFFEISNSKCILPVWLAHDDLILISTKREEKIDKLLNF